MVVRWDEAYSQHTADKLSSLFVHSAESRTDILEAVFTIWRGMPAPSAGFLNLLPFPCCHHYTRLRVPLEQLLASHILKGSGKDGLIRTSALNDMRS